MIKMETTAKNPKTTDLGTAKECTQNTDGQAFKDIKKKERNIPASGWITKFRKRPGNEWLEEIDGDFLRDFTNLTGLDEEICYLSHGLHIILSDGLYLDSHGNSIIRTKTEGKHLDAAEMLYILVHARYVLTNKGLEKVLKKYKEGFYGSCPRYYCAKTKVLPIGMSDKFGKGDVKMFCPSCEDMYHTGVHENDLVDGACFGTNLPQMFFMAYPTLHPSPTLGHYVPKLYGFKIHGSVEHQHGDVTEFKMHQKRQTKHHRSKNMKEKLLKNSCKENDPSHDNTKDKLPAINGHCNHPEKTAPRRRRRKRTTEMKIH